MDKELRKKFKKEQVQDYRNQYLAKLVEESSSDKIVIIYGANHFKGLWEELDKIDSTWNYDSTFPDYLDRED